MPENKAAVSLPPTENTARPHWNAVIRIWKTRASTTITSGAAQSAGSPNGRQPPSRRLDTSKYRPSVMMNASPRVMPITPSVAMNGGSRTITISAALSRPAARPTSTPVVIAGPSAQPSRHEQVAGDHAGQRHHGAGRQIDAAGDDHDRGADRGDAVDRRVLQDQQAVARVQERVRSTAVGPQPPGEECDLERPGWRRC